MNDRIRRTPGAVPLLVLLISQALFLAGLGAGCFVLENASNPGGSADVGVDSEHCSVWADGVCDPAADETCACADCADAAWCHPVVLHDGDSLACTGQDGFCDPVADYCICPDCEKDPYCAALDHNNCTDGDGCDAYLEGCQCADCKATLNCPGTGGTGGSTGGTGGSTGGTGGSTGGTGGSTGGTGGSTGGTGGSTGGTGGG